MHWHVSIRVFSYLSELRFVVQQSIEVVDVGRVHVCLRDAMMIVKMQDSRGR